MISQAKEKQAPEACEGLTFQSWNYEGESYMTVEEVYHGYSLVEFRYHTLEENGDSDGMGTIQYKWYPSNTTYGSVIQDGKNVLNSG